MRLLAAGMWLALAGCEDAAEPARPAARPEVALLSSLPIVFGESFSLDAPRHALLAALEERFTVTPVDGPEQLRPRGLLLAVQPQALTAERLVALDKWVRGGGRMVLLADPSLTFESRRPLGDRFRPPPTFPDTGLLSHWGLTLEPEGEPFAEVVPFDLGEGVTARATSFGSVSVKGSACQLTPARTVARCRIGRGAVTVVADADFALRDTSTGNQAAVVALVAERIR